MENSIITAVGLLLPVHKISPIALFGGLVVLRLWAVYLYIVYIMEIYLLFLLIVIIRLEKLMQVKILDTMVSSDMKLVNEVGFEMRYNIC